MSLFVSLCLFVMLIPVIVLPEVYVSTECYGNALSISCEQGHRIKVIDDFFGVSGSLRRVADGEDVCQYHPGDCTVTNNRYSSLIHRFCEGKATCTNFQVDRRYCGVNHTNYEQVEYECVNEKDIVDMCSTISVSTLAGYLATPNFPNEYPPSKDCMCTLWTASEDVGIKLEATHFVVKYDRPCQDWVEIDSGRHKRRICGAYRSTIVSDFFQVTFHSDNFQGHQGAWLRFSSYPESSNVTVHATCRPETYLPAKVILPPHSLTPAPTPTTPIVTDPDFVLSHEVSTEDHVTKGNDTVEESSDGIKYAGTTESEDSTVSAAILDIDMTLHVNKTVTIVEGIIVNSDDNIVLGRTDQLDAKSNSVTSDKSTAKSVKKPDRKKGNANHPKKVYVPHRNNVYKSGIKEGSIAVKTTSAKPYVPWGHQVLEEQENIYRGVQGASFIVETIPKSSRKQPVVGIADEVPSLSNKQKDQAESDLSELLKTPFHSKHITGVIIISICVGGIVVLVVVLGVLVCVSRSKKPKRSLSRQRRRNERLQERLNTLSFYDSIPLYDSIGHRGGVARAPVPFNMADTANLSATDLDLTASTSTTQPVQPVCPVNQAGFEAGGAGPYWTSFHRTPLQELEFESSLYIDSSIYASINRSFTSGERTRSHLASATEIKGQGQESEMQLPPSPKPGSVDGSNLETANPVSVNISYHCEEEDVCTHV